MPDWTPQARELIEALRDGADLELLDELDRRAGEAADCARLLAQAKRPWRWGTEHLGAPLRQRGIQATERVPLDDWAINTLSSRPQTPRS